MQALYATCPSATLHLREPLSPSAELPLAAFVWFLVMSPLPPLLSPLFLYQSVSLSFAPCAFFTKTDTQTDTRIQSSDCFCQLFPASAYRHKVATANTSLPPPPTACACHLWSRCQVLGLLCQPETPMIEPDRGDGNQQEADDI